MNERSCDPKVFISKFDSLFDKRPKPETLSWSDFVGRYGKHAVVRDKKAACLLSPAEWPANDCERKAANVLRVHFAALDLDGVAPDVVTGIRALLEPYAYLMYTTWSHAQEFKKSGLWYLRVLVPLSRPVEMREWKAFWPRLSHFFGDVTDSNCKDPGRVYYVPSSGEDCLENRVFTQPGRSLHVDSLLSAPEPGAASHADIGRPALQTYAKLLRSRTGAHSQRMGEILTKVLKGDVFAEPGKRDDTIYKLAGILAEKWPHIEPEALAAHFKPSLAKMASTQSDAPTIDDVIEKIGRQQEAARKEASESAGSGCDSITQRIRLAFAGERETPYTDEELECFAKEQGVSRQDFTKRWIVEEGASYYVFKGGDYQAPVSLHGLYNTAYTDLAPAITAGVDCFRITDKGASIEKTEKQLIRNYGTTAKRAIATFSASKSYYDWKTDTFVEAVCPLRPLAPEYSEQVDRYLRLLGGKQAQILLDWVSVVTKLDEPCAALFLHGVPGSGKTLLANGLTRLWSEGEATNINQVLGSAFNAALTNCPLILADEQLPSFIKREGSTAELRELIQGTQRTLTRKFKSVITLKGAVRLIITANNRNLFNTRDALSNEDISAVRDRILYLYAGQESKDYLSAMNRAERKEMVVGDEIAKHALWLRDHHQPQNEDRFMVPGQDSLFHQSLVTGTGFRPDVCQWLTNYLLNPNPVNHDSERLIRIEDGQLLVTARALSSFWKIYDGTDKKPPRALLISDALSGLSSGKKHLRNGNDVPTNYWKIRTELLIGWNIETGYAEEQQILTALESAKNPQEQPKMFRR